MTRVYRYSIIRFRPLAETGEFANVGVLVLALQTGELAFQLAPRRFQRVRGFFDAAIHEAYGTSVDILTLELERATTYLPNRDGNDGVAVFESITHKRESSITFSESRVIEAMDELGGVTERLYGRFVRREVGPAETAEVILAKDIRKALAQQGIKYFKSLRVKDDIVPVQFPLGFNDGAIHAIKPLAFSQKSSLAVFDYAASWRKRFEYLMSVDKIREGNVILAVEAPSVDAESPIMQAFDLAVDELTALPFRIVPAENNGIVNPEIIDFAERVRPYQRRFLN